MVKDQVEGIKDVTEVAEMIVRNNLNLSWLYIKEGKGE